ncbi:MAG: hypothetical protein GX550_01165 [Syntrophomonadaceae bacterium]|nr:hypothetical protein [Syntrophomonadaceae bacterium]
MEPSRESPGLFCTNGEWPRASDYELIKTKSTNLMWVAPTANAVIEYYRPFECFPDILVAFFEMASELQSDKTDERKGQAVIKFARRFGLFGLFSELINNILGVSTNGAEYRYVISKTLDGEVVPLFSLLSGDNNYDSYVKYLFPRLEAPYPLPPGARNQKGGTLFWNEYAEPIFLIQWFSSSFYKNFRTWQNWVAAKNTGASLDDPCGSSDPEIKWRQALKFSAPGIGISLEFSDKGLGSWQQRYMFNSLIKALRIMYILDRIGTFTQVNACEWCGRIYQATKPTARWCSTACGSGCRVTKTRKKGDIIQLHKQGMIIQDIAAKLKIDVKWVAEWLPELEEA